MRGKLWLLRPVIGMFKTVGRLAVHHAWAAFMACCLKGCSSRVCMAADNQ
jgi:hypothetical protein